MACSLFVHSSFIERAPSDPLYAGLTPGAIGDRLHAAIATTPASNVLHADSRFVYDNIAGGSSLTSIFDLKSHAAVAVRLTQKGGLESALSMSAR